MEINKPSVELCMKCKGRLWCNLDGCPFYSKLNASISTNKILNQKNKNIKSDLDTSSNDVFVSKSNYPNISFGILSPVDSEKENFMSPKDWHSKNMKVDDIIRIRSKIINSNQTTGIKPTKKIVVDGQEISLSQKPVDVEVGLKYKPQFKLDLNATSSPMGPSVKLKNLRLTSNPKIPKIADEVLEDKKLKSVDGMNLLYDKGYEEDYIRKILSAGGTGKEKNRKLVPTRWAITAVDDTLGKKNIKQIHNYDDIDTPIAFFDSYLGNYYMIIMLPGPWSYELFEMYLPKASWNFGTTLKWMTDFEFSAGRKDYAEDTAGGYYAARLSITEKLKAMKKRASVLVLRVITSEYYVPLGVWVVREASRQSLKSAPTEFEDKNQALNYTKEFLSKKFNINPKEIDRIYSESNLLKNMKTQKRINQFF